MDRLKAPSLETDGQSRYVRAWEILLVFLKLGLTSFGGPIAHLGYFREEFVQRRRWISDATYADLVALCQFLPGPASSQVGFALGYIRAGLWGALLAWLGFTLPSAVIMIGFGYGLHFIQPDSAWMHGLKLAAVAIVAQAVWGMAVKLCPDRTRMTMAGMAAAAVLGLNSPWMQLAVIGIAMIVGWLYYVSRISPQPYSENFEEFRYVHRGRFAFANLTIFAALFLGLPWLAFYLQNDEWVALANSFYRAGTLVFGGGHVVLPLLESETVGKSLLSRSDFLAGYGAAQALPGPLFTFAAYLGTVIMPDGPGWLAGLWCLTALMLPSFLLVIGGLPYWKNLRQSPSARAALNGANAAVVGILIAAFYRPVLTSSIDSIWSVVIALIGFCALQFWKFPPWVIVAGCAATAGFLL